jgi:glycerophosphoryl diester phosphodiesterase
VGPVADLRVEHLPESVPLLEAALESLYGLLVNIEIKNSPLEPGFDPDEGAARLLIDLLRDRRGADRVVVSSFTLASIDTVKALAPGIPTAVLSPAMADPAWTITTALEAGHDGIHPEDPVVTAEVVEQARDAGLAVRVWTVDDPARVIELVGFGVDAVITNEVARTLAAVRATGD